MPFCTFVKVLKVVLLYRCLTISRRQTCLGKLRWLLHCLLTISRSQNAFYVFHYITLSKSHLPTFVIYLNQRTFYNKRCFYCCSCINSIKARVCYRSLITPLSKTLLIEYFKDSSIRVVANKVATQFIKIWVLYF